MRTHGTHGTHVVSVNLRTADKTTIYLISTLNSELKYLFFFFKNNKIKKCNYLISESYKISNDFRMLRFLVFSSLFLIIFSYSFVPRVLVRQNTRLNAEVECIFPGNKKAKAATG